MSAWEFTHTGDARHMGPMAGEIADAFELGDDAESIASVDSDGVALAAIQGLAERRDTEDEQLDEKADRIEDLEAETEHKDDRITALEAETADVRAETEALPRAVGRP